GDKCLQEKLLKEQNKKRLQENLFEKTSAGPIYMYVIERTSTIEEKMGTKGKIKKKNRERKQDRNDSHRNTAMEQLNTEPQDHISCFPDDILFRIISFLPFESAVHTTFLSKQWKDLWKKNLILNTTMEDIIVTILNLVYDFTELHPSKNKWGLQFNLDQDRLLFVSITPNRTLHLDFSPAEQEFPASFDWLLPLRLPSAYKPDEMIMKLNPPLSLYAQIKIKTLYLVSVSHLSSKAVTCLVSNLPFLESLIIEKCNGVQSLVVQDAGVLQKLFVLDCPQLRTLSFQGPHLGQGLLKQWTWDFETNTDHPYFPSQGSYHCGCTTKDKCFKSILRTIDWVTSLTICRWFFEKTICKNLFSSSKGPESYFSQLKELWWIDCSMTRHNIDVLLCFLKLCPNVERLYVTMDPKCYNLTSSIPENFLAIVGAPENLNGLKVVKLEGFVGEQMEIFVARRLVPLFGENNPVIISKSYGKCLKHLVKVDKLENKA
ncbi:hypothetical protein Goarm_009823, partial [Gossypium armourianum]|nr:hypothetical protein [Gossypium armourianum]